MQTYKKLLFLLSHSERKNAVFLLVMILIMALLDMMGVASILPFMAVLTNPDIIENAQTIKANFSTGPILRASTAKGAETVIRTKSLNVSPVTEENKAIFVAF